MTTLTATNPVSEAVFAALQDDTLLTAVDGRVVGDLDQDTPRPCVLYEIFNETDIHGIGTGHLPEIDLRIHTFSQLVSEAQAINKLIVSLLKDATLVITGFAHAGTVVYHETQTLRDQDLFGIKVHEVVSLYTIWAEQTV